MDFKVTALLHTDEVTGTHDNPQKGDGHLTSDFCLVPNSICAFLCKLNLLAMSPLRELDWTTNHAALEGQVGRVIIN